MKHLRSLIAPGMIFAQALLLAWGAARHTPVIDEPAHLAAGLSNWELGRFELFKVNPPLVRMLAALPVLAAGAKTNYGSYSRGVGVRAEFAVMDAFVRVNGPRVIWLVMLARCALIPVVLRFARAHRGSNPTTTPSAKARPAPSARVRWRVDPGGRQRSSREKRATGSLRLRRR